MRKLTVNDLVECLVDGGSINGCEPKLVYTGALRVTGGIRIYEFAGKFYCRKHKPNAVIFEEAKADVLKEAADALFEAAWQLEDGQGRLTRHGIINPTAKCLLFDTADKTKRLAQRLKAVKEALEEEK